jgi:uncharacterized BrkB/YihY/UPF0761 family membrane protein
VSETDVPGVQAGRLRRLGAALTYYGVLAIFPALIALTSIIGVVEIPKMPDALLKIV